MTAAREQVYAPTRALAVEQAVADTIERLATTGERRPVDSAVTAWAVDVKDHQLGRRLTAGQIAAVEAITGSDGRVQFVVGVAGDGKTTALDAATSALEADGHRVIGTSTSGQAARTLGAEAAIEAATVASLLWRLDHGRERLCPDTVVVLDEAAMTTDDDLLRLVTAVDVTGARLVLVGDPRQLGAVGPGGAMAALMARRRHLVTRLAENVRQHDPGERHAIAELRAGRVDRALAWYRANDRIHHHPDPADALNGIVAAWDRDVDAGLATTMLAWRRDDVELLNQRARTAAIAAGRVHGPSVDAGDLEIAEGDQLIALQPIRRVGIVTSHRLNVTAIDPDRGVVAVESAGELLELELSEVDRDRFAYGYATTIHRAQGATFDTCRLFAAGGTHQLAYVALTRARHQTVIHTMADTAEQAVEDLRADWARPDSQRWIIDDRPDPLHGVRTPRRVDVALERARLRAEHDALRQLSAALFNTTEQRQLTVERAGLVRAQHELRAGTGEWTDTPAGRAVRRFKAARSAHTTASARAESPALSRRERREARQQADQLVEAIEHSEAAWIQHGQPIDERLAAGITKLDRQLDEMPNASEAHERAILLQQRISHLETELGLGVGHHPDSPARNVGLGLGL